MPHCNYNGPIGSMGKQRAAGSSAPACSPGFKYIPNWPTLDLTCCECGTTKSVKYRRPDGRVVCNLCVYSRRTTGVSLER